MAHLTLVAVGLDKPVYYAYCEDCGRDIAGPFDTEAEAQAEVDKHTS